MGALPLDRRAALGAAAAALALAASGRALAQAIEGLTADDGSPIRAFRAPGIASLTGLPGVLAQGPAEADAAIVELFDYNCGYCRQASSGLDQMLHADSRLRLVFIHNPILSPASARAAEVVLAVQTLHGAQAAYGLHRRLLETPGRANEQSALAYSRAAGLDAEKIADVSNGAPVVEAIRAQKLHAATNRMRFTPTFVMAGVAFIGWPGVPTMQRFAAAARRCGALRCDAGAR